ncbi:GH25 family lysozyme [Lacticaseibacillus sp. GG6-2]
MTLKGVDVASYQTPAQAGQADIDFVIVKATEGLSYVNPKCNAEYAAAKKAGHLLGLYHYASGGDPVAEANYLIANIKNYVGEAVLALDWEQGSNVAWGNTGWALKFVQRVHTLTGVWPLIYVQASAVAQVASCAPYCGLWIAGYPVNADSWTVPSFPYSTGAWKSATIWQFTSAGIDRNIFYGNKAAWGKYAKTTISSGTVNALKVTVTNVAKPKPVAKAKTWKDARGVKWTAESGKATLKSAINLRWGATTESSKIATLPAGSVVTYDAKCVSGGYIWIRQPRSGSYGYLAVGRADSAGRNVDPYATFK